MIKYTNTKQEMPIDICRHIIVENCKACLLYKKRKNIVNGFGNRNSSLMLVGEAPGKEEDLIGKPFVGASGKLIDKSLNLINITREDIYISNVVKCRPPNNRDPNELEIKTCLPYLIYEIIAIKPKVICLLGRVASKVFISDFKSITKQEGKIYTILNSIKIIPVCHPSYYLRNYAPKERFFSTIKKAYAECLV